MCHWVDGFHVFVPQTTGNPEKIRLVSDGVCRAEVGQLQGVGNGEVLYGVVGGIGVDVVSVKIKHVVQVMISKVA